MSKDASISATGTAKQAWDFMTDKSRNINDKDAFDSLDQYILESIDKNN